MTGCVTVGFFEKKAQNPVKKKINHGEFYFAE